MKKILVTVTAIHVEEVEVPDCFEPDPEKMRQYMPEFIEWAELDVDDRWLPLSIEIDDAEQEPLM